MTVVSGKFLERKDGEVKVRRMILLCAAVLLMVMMALPALAQEDGGDGGVPVEQGEDSGAAISIGVTVVFVSGAIAYVIEFIRGKFSSLDGDVIRGISLLLSVGAVLAWDLRVAADYGYAGLPDALDVIASALVITGASGLLASWKNAQRSKDPTSSLFVSS